MKTYNDNMKQHTKIHFHKYYYFTLAIDIVLGQSTPSFSDSTPTGTSDEAISQLAAAPEHTTTSTAVASYQCQC